MTPTPPRALALVALRDWRKSNRFADAILHRFLGDSTLAAADRAFATDLVYGVLRNLTLLDYWIALLRRGNVDHDSRDLLRLGLYQLLVLKVAEHAAVFETVALAKPRARSLINAVLRSAQNRREELVTEAQHAPLATRFSHPAFLIERWTAQFGEANAAAICRWNNQPPPLYGRINQLKISPTDFLERYEGSEPLAAFPNLVRLREFPAHALAQGHCYVQDPSTVVVCDLLDPQPNEIILDACAAPGGKTSYLAELMGNRGRIVATDRDRLRLATVEHNLQSLGVEIAATQAWDWSGDFPPPAEIAGPFDRILIDAPCSNTGVMRRRVDVRWRLTPNDFLRMQTEQLKIVRHVVPLLKSGGNLVFSTCSLEPEENAAVANELERNFPHLKLADQKAVTPFADELDGAYAARFISER